MTQIITPQDLKEQSLIDKNVSDFYCDQAIKISQEVNLEQLIGENLYNAIIARIVANTLTGKYKELVDNYIKDFLYLDATSEIQIPLSFKNRQMGVVRTTDENVMSAELSQVQYLKDYYKHRANYYALKIKNFIEKYEKDFPEYHTEDCNGIKPNNKFRPNINI
jgi:hypothetical protein